MRAELQAVLQAVRSIPADELPRLLGELREVEATALARLSSPAPQPQADALLDVDAAAERLGCSAHYLYRNHKKLTFTRRTGRNLRFSAAGIARHISQQKA